MEDKLDAQMESEDIMSKLEALQAENRNLKTQLAACQQENKDLKTQLALGQGPEVFTYKKDIEDIRAQLAIQDTQLTAQTKAMDDMETKLSEKAKEVSTLKTGVKELKRVKGVFINLVESNTRIERERA